MRYIAPTLSVIDYMTELGYAVSEIQTGADGTEEFTVGGELGFVYP